jgi:hypothetical protein
MHQLEEFKNDHERQLWTRVYAEVVTCSGCAQAACEADTAVREFRKRNDYDERRRV